MEAIRWAVLALGVALGAYCLRTSESQPLDRPGWATARWSIRGLAFVFPAVCAALFHEWREPDETER